MRENGDKSTLRTIGLIPFRVLTVRNIHERKLIGIFQRGEFEIDVELRPIDMKTVR